MAEPAVVNASPLIFLSRAGLLDLLQLVSSEIIVPEIVASEIEIRGKSDPTAQAIANTAWLVVTQMPPVPTQIQERLIKRVGVGILHALWTLCFTHRSPSRVLDFTCILGVVFYNRGDLDNSLRASSGGN